MSNKKKSFTLIELLVVIVIIGILAGVIMISTSSSIDKANIAKSKVFEESVSNNLAANMVSRWKLDEIVETNKTPDVWGSNTGTLIGPNGLPQLRPSSECVTDGCFQFDGVDNYVDCQNNFGLDIKDEITINLWIKINILDNQYRAVIDVLPHYPIKQTNSNQIRFQIKTIDGLNEVYFTAPQIETWYHLALSYSKNDPNGLIAYINGVKIGNRNTYSGQMSSISSTWKIGGPRSSPTLTFDGSIDDVRIYNAAISSSQIKQNYIAGLDSMFANGNISKQEYNKRINELAYE